MKLNVKIITGFNFERKSDIYKNIGVHQFKKIVPFGDLWIRLYNTIASKNLRLIKSKNNAIIWLIFTLSVEALHMLAFLIISWFIVQATIEFDYEKVFRLVGINILVNLYPLMIQRYNRIRLFKIFKLSMKDLKEFQITA